jgi:hypothetical protein
MSARDRQSGEGLGAERQHGSTCNIDADWPPQSDLSEIFTGLTRDLLNSYPISRGVLLVKAGDAARFLAVSTWNEGRVRRNLSLRLPSNSSLFEKIAESGQVYTENFCALFSGNTFERNLLIGDKTKSYVVQPLKLEGAVVGLVGYSSDKPTAFVTFEEGALSGISSRLAARIDQARRSAAEAR